MGLDLLINALEKGEDLILKNLLSYAAEAEYTRYTSTKEDEWRMAVREPARALIRYLKEHEIPDSIHVDEHFEKNDSAAFGILEAKRHRERGIRFDMFLGLTKLMRQAFDDLVYNTPLSGDDLRLALAITQRFFDKFELGFCTEWVRFQETDIIRELQDTNRSMTNEKNRYMTIFHSMAEPAYVVDREMHIVEVNKALEDFYEINAGAIVGKNCENALSHGLCLQCPLQEVMRNRTSFSNMEIVIKVQGEDKTVLLSGSFLDDISGKYAGGIAILQDITERKRAEESLKKAKNGLEIRVNERTRELLESNAMLKEEIAERKKAQEAMRRSEKELRNLSLRLLNAQEDESKRIALELHDGLGQNLSAIKFKIETVIRELDETKYDKYKKSLESVVPIVQEAVDEVRGLARRLRPAILDDLGILATISWLCREFEDVYSGISIDKDIDIEENEISESIKVVIYRIMQEALNNIAKHSSADHVDLSLNKNNGKISLVIKDNGCGFDPKELGKGDKMEHGLGMTSMKERTELTKGFFTLDSSRGKGTVIKAWWHPEGREDKPFYF